MTTVIIKADLSSEELQVLISEITILHRDVFKKPLILQQTPCYTMLPLSEQYNVWIKETKRNGGVLVGSSIKEFFKWLEDRNSGVFSGNIV